MMSEKHATSFALSDTVLKLKLKSSV